MREILVALVVFGTAAASWAEPATEHEHGPRHGGYFGDADDLYHYELVLESSDQLALYVGKSAWHF